MLFYEMPMLDVVVTITVALYLVRRQTARWISGAARTTKGSIVIQARAQERSQCQRNAPPSMDGTLAMPVAIRHVIPD